MSWKIQARVPPDEQWFSTGESYPTLDGLPDVEYATYDDAHAAAEAWFAVPESEGTWRSSQVLSP